MRKIISSYLSLFFVAAFFLSGGCAEKLKSSPDQKVLAEFIVPSDSNLIFIPVRFDEEEYLFCLDTGSNTTIFDVSLKNKLGKRILWPKKGEAALGKPMKVEYFRAPQAYLGPLNLKDCMIVGVVDLEPVSFALANKIHGIIGMDFLKKYVSPL